MSDKLSYSNFKLIGPKTAILHGKTRSNELMELRNWLRTIKVEGDEGYILLIDSAGGYSDPAIVVDLIQAPVHTHILKAAESFAALLFMGGSLRTCSEGATFMLHKSHWDNTTSSEAIAEDGGLLLAHRRQVRTLISTLAPCGDLKQEMLDAVQGNEDVYFDVNFLYDMGSIDRIGNLNLSYLNLYKGNELWFNRKYNDCEGEND